MGDLLALLGTLLLGLAGLGCVRFCAALLSGGRRER